MEKTYDIKEVVINSMKSVKNINEMDTVENNIASYLPVVSKQSQLLSISSDY